MKNPSIFIYSGLLIILLGFGDDSWKLIPSEFVFSSGVLFILYGIFLHFKLKGKLPKNKFDWKINLRNLSSKVYILIGIIILRMDRFTDIFDDRIELNITKLIIGITIILYGLSLHFKDKRERGDIE